jgi:DNA-binding XRE family transcriptional regulator
MSSNLRTLRRQLGLSQSELAAAIGVSRRTVCDHERGVKIPPQRRRLVLLATLLLALKPELIEELRR